MMQTLAIGTPRKTLLKDAEKAADLVVQPRHGQQNNCNNWAHPAQSQTGL